MFIHARDDDNERLPALRHRDRPLLHGRRPGAPHQRRQLRRCPEQRREQDTSDPLYS